MPAERMKTARVKAAHASRRPAPTSERSRLTTGVAVSCRMRLMSAGVSAEFASSISAATPATWGAEKEVPLSVAYGAPPLRPCGAAAVMASPGASRTGW